MKHFLIRVSLVAVSIGLCVSSSTAGRQNVVNAVQERVYSNWTLLQSNRPPTPTVDSPLLRETSCGKKTTSLMTHLTGRIAGGSVATPNEYPWMVYLQIYTSKFSAYYYVCGGTLISNQWILTSANCLEGAQSINVYLGAHDINSQNEWQRIMYTTTVYIQHPNWNSQTNTADDIALIKLPVAINYNAYIKSICLPSFDDPSHEGDTVFLTGWGRTSGYDINGPLSPTLRETTSTVISNAECSAVYGGSIITANTICSSGTGGKGICPSDNGGPMSYMTTDGNFVQIGVASFYSSTGCENGHPSGFTRIQNYLDWISTETGVITPNSASAMGNSICYKLVIVLVLAIHYF
ncbi:brachyurin-like isoform X2 [Daphnia pulex]|uniref:brachyurin-like isoform X2 n=1 Tax=Daphnia pulex TaxID=6669 RepID=UPI001EE05A4C|nr:brachyurin-like isoform X2 [Daphnia pulex]